MKKYNKPVLTELTRTVEVIGGQWVPVVRTSDGITLIDLRDDGGLFTRPVRKKASDDR